VSFAFAAVLLVALGLATLVHELGHAGVAHLLGLRVHRIAFGLGPRVWRRRTRGGTELELRLLPVWAGAELEIPGEGEKGSSLGRRALVLAAGPAANVLWAFTLLTSLYLAGTHVPVPLAIGMVLPGSEAAKAQLRPGDRVTALNGVALSSWGELVDRIDAAGGRDLSVTFFRDGAEQTVVVRPQEDATGVARIGITQQYVYKEQSLVPAAVSAALHLWRIAFESAELVVRLGRPVPGAAFRSGLPWQLTDAAPTRMISAIRIEAALSALLALFHLVPLPPLDAGSLLLLLAETQRGKRLSPRRRGLLHVLGFVALGVLLVAVALRIAR
jgi:regulator of sigma E protease